MGTPGTLEWVSLYGHHSWEHIEKFPYNFIKRTITINAASIFLKLKNTIDYSDEDPVVFELTKDEDINEVNKKLIIEGSPLQNAAFTNLEDLNEGLGRWYFITDDEGIINYSENIEDLYLILLYHIS